MVRGLAEQLTEAYRDSQAEVAVSSVHPNYIPVNNQSDDGGNYLDDVNSSSHSPSGIMGVQHACVQMETDHEDEDGVDKAEGDRHKVSNLSSRGICLSSHVWGSLNCRVRMPTPDHYM